MEVCLGLVSKEHLPHKHADLSLIPRPYSGRRELTSQNYPLIFTSVLSHVCVRVCMRAHTQTHPQSLHGFIITCVFHWRSSVRPRPLRIRPLGSQTQMFPSFNFLGKIPPPVSYLGFLNCEMMAPTVPRIAASVRQAYETAHNNGRQDLRQATAEALGPGICFTNTQQNPEVVGGEGRAPVTHLRMWAGCSDLQVVRVLAWLFLKNKISKEVGIGGSREFPGAQELLCGILWKSATALGVHKFFFFFFFSVCLA